MDAQVTYNYLMSERIARAQYLSANFPMQEVKVGEQVYVSLNEETRYEAGTMSIEDYIAELQEIAAEAPEGCAAFISFDVEGDYEDGYTTTRRIGYWRNPTPEEVAARKEHNRKAREHNKKLAKRREVEQDAAERAEFERLKAKFDAPTA